MYKKIVSAKIRRKKSEGNSKDGLFPALNTQARKDAHLTQAELAEKLGITTTTLVSYEKGRSPIKADLLVKYAEICNVSTDCLLGLSNEKVYTKEEIMNILEGIKHPMMYEIYMKGVNMTDEYQGCWVRFREIEKVVDKYFDSILYEQEKS